MNTRTAAATLALATLNLTAIALQGEDEPAAFAPNDLVVASAAVGELAEYDASGASLPQPITGLAAPEDLAFAPDGTLFVSERDADVVRVLDADGTVLQSLGEGSGLDAPTGLTFGPDGTLYVSSSGTDRVLVFDREGGLVRQIGADDGVLSPWGVAFDPEGRLCVAGTGSDRVFVFDPAGTLVDDIGGDGELSAPRGLCFGADGELYVASSGSDEVAVFDAAGELARTLGGDTALSAPVGVAFGPDGLLYVNSSGNGRVLAFDAAGALVRDLSAPGDPRGLAFAPFLYEATLKGTLQRPGQAPLKFKSKARLALAPGRIDVGLRLLDPLDPLVDTWGSDTWVLQGASLAPSKPGKTRLFSGEQLGAASAYAGLASLQLTQKGKLDGDSVENDAALPPRFAPARASGSFQRSGPQGIASGTVKTGKLVKP